MYTISNIVEDISRGCTANNMVEDRFSYRIIFFVNKGDTGSKHYVNTVYADLRKELENIIRNHLSLNSNVVIAQTTVRKNGESICLQSRAYSFSLEEYFKRISGESRDNNRNGNIIRARYAVR